MPETFVIGAGPYGISLATHLRARQVPFEIVGEPMQSWRKHMPPGMVLKSEPFASSLWDPDRVFSLEKFCELRGASYDAIGTPVPLYKFLSYADWFQQQTKLDIRNRTLVRLVRTAAGFDLTFADGERTAARRVVLATGYLPYRWVPPVLRDLPAELASHSADHCDLGRFAGRDVTIVGSGQSGLETAALLHEQGTTTRVLARASQIYWNGAPKPDRSFLSQARWPDSGIGIGWRAWTYAERPAIFHRLPAQLRTRIVATNWGPAGSWWLKQRLVDKVPLLAGHEIVAAQERNGRLRLTVRGAADTQTFDTDHVIAATGYKVDLDRLPFLDQALTRRHRGRERRAAAQPIVRILGARSLFCRRRKRAEFRSGHALHVRRQASGAHAGASFRGAVENCAFNHTGAQPRVRNSRPGRSEFLGKRVDHFEPRRPIERVRSACRPRQA